MFFHVFPCCCHVVAMLLMPMAFDAAGNPAMCDILLNSSSELGWADPGEIFTLPANGSMLLSKDEYWIDRGIRSRSAEGKDYEA